MLINSILRDRIILKNQYQSKENAVPDPKIPVGAEKKQWFNFDVYSSGHVYDRAVCKWVTFKTRTNTRTIKGKEYKYKTKRNVININHNGVNKKVTVSLANLIGILFVPNKDRCKFIHYKSGGRYNCDANNLYWSDEDYRSNRIKVLPQKLKKIYSSISESELNGSSKSAYLYYTTKNLTHLYEYFKKDKRFFYSKMIEAYKLVCPSVKNVSLSIIDDVYEKFISDVPSLIDRGFYIPNGKMFHSYCKCHLVGRLKQKLVEKFKTIYCPDLNNEYIFQ